MLVIANKGTISVARKQEVAENPRMTTRSSELHPEAYATKWSWGRSRNSKNTRPMKNENATWQVELKNWNGQERSMRWWNWRRREFRCISRRMDTVSTRTNSKHVTATNEWTRWKTRSEFEPCATKKWTTAVHVENANRNDATNLLVSATELFINGMMPRVHGETEAISYKHGFFIFKIKKNN